MFRKLCGEQKFFKMSIIEIKGYKILNISLDKDIRHHILYKKHETLTIDKDDSRSIFFCNLPINTNLKIFKKLFEKISIGSTIENFTSSYITDSIEDTYIDLPELTSDLDVSRQKTPEVNHKLPKYCGVLTFIDKAAFQLAFTNLTKLTNKETLVLWPRGEEYGSTYFLNKFKSQILDIGDLTQQVVDGLNAFDQAEHESIDNFKNQRQLVDEDGFTLVVSSQRKTKAGVLSQQKLAVDKAASELAKNKMKKKEKEDFYRFQLRQRKKDEMNELLKKFKHDQEKIRLMKEKKRFRPY